MTRVVSPLATAKRLQRIAASAYSRLSGIPGDNGDGYPAYVEGARKAGMDVNDWEERTLGWVPALPILERLVFPAVRRDSVICELGTGTGRWSRHLAAAAPEGEVILVDRSRWLINFLTGYFADRKNVRVLRGNGVSLPIDEAGRADVAFSQGVFVTFKLGLCAVYLSEFNRVLKTGGVAVFDFIDPETEGGWKFFERETPASFDVFAYHTLAVMTKVLNHEGFDVERSEVIGKSTYVVCRKR